MFIETSLPFLALLTLRISGALTFIGFVLLFFRKHQWVGHFFGIITTGGAALLLVVSILMMYVPINADGEIFSLPLGIVTVGFHVDALSIFFILLVNVIGLAASWNNNAFLEGNTAKNFWQEPITFHTFVNLFHFTMLLVPMVDNLIGVWIAIELTTLGSAFLVAYQRDRSSWEATWKYLVITSTGIILALLGTMFLANSIPLDVIKEIKTNKDQVLNWTFLMDLAKGGELDNTKSFVWLAFLFALLGYGTKAGLAPMHTWLPDGHGEAPSPISALLSGVLLKSALYAILRFYTLTNVVLEDNKIWTSYAILFVGMLSLVVAVPFILKENVFKRVLAYHSLEHMGIITFGIGVGGPIAISGAVLHILNHAITKALMFLAFGNVMKQYEKRGIRQKEINGVLRTMPLTGALLSLGGLALVGTPPFNVFMSEFIILWGGIDQLWNSYASIKPVLGKPILVIAISIFIISTSLIFYGLMNHMGKLLLNNLEDNPNLENGSTWEKVGWQQTGPLIFLFVLMLSLGLWVFPPLAILINRSVQVILGIG